MVPYFDKEEIEEYRIEELHEAKESHDLSNEELRQLYCGVHGLREALHAAWILHENVQKYLMRHPAIIFDPEAWSHAFRAHESLFDLYQRMGALEVDLTDSWVQCDLETGEKGA